MSFLARRWTSLTGIDSKRHWGWALYDWANSAYATTIMATLLPIYFADVAANNLPEHLRTAYWGYASAIAFTFIALAAPIVGAMSDLLGSHKKFLLMCMSLGVVSSALL